MLLVMDPTKSLLMEFHMGHPAGFSLYLTPCGSGAPTPFQVPLLVKAPTEVNLEASMGLYTA